MNDKPTIDPKTLPPLTRFIYTLGQLPTSYLMSMTYEEQLVWLCNYLGTQVIPAVNQNGQAVEELQNLYELLRTYVNGYFDNLDVQEEINNKLDKMADDGSLTTLIKNYIDPIYRAYEIRIDGEVESIRNEVESVVNGTPIPVSSTSDMTDTTRVYLLLTDGYIYYYNGTAWTQGWVYQAAEDSDTLSELVEDYSNYKEKTTNISPNRFNKDDTTTKTNYYYNGEVGDTLAATVNNTFYCGIIPVESGETITLSSSGFRILFINDSDEILARSRATETSAQAPFTVTVPNTSGITKMAFSWKKTGTTGIPLDTYMAVKGDSLPSTYMPYGYIFNDDYIEKLTEKIESDNESKEFFVGYGLDDNNRYFNHVVDCLYKVQETSGFKTVHIRNGVYDILSELGGMTYINSKNTTDDTWRTVQPVITDSKIIGHGNVILNFNLEPTTQEHYWLFSALNISGNCELENIEIHSSNCRYSIHDESGDDYPNTYRKYKNVRCFNTNNQAAGCGYSQNTNVYIDNCQFETNGSQAGYSCHANNGVKVIINNSVFKASSGSDLRISQNGGIGTNGRIYAEISNCFLPHGLSVRNEYNHSVPDRTEVNIINTYVDELAHQYTDIAQPVTSYNTITGVKTVLLNITE